MGPSMSGEEAYQLLEKRLQSLDDKVIKYEFTNEALLFVCSLPKCMWCTHPQLMIELLLMFSLEADEEGVIQNFISKIEKDLSNCVSCIDAYHQGKKVWIARHKDRFAKEAFSEFIFTLTNWDTQRLVKCLNTAQLQSQYAMYEILSFPEMFSDLKLQNAFSSTLKKGIDTGKPFKLNSLLPGIFFCMFFPDASVIEWSRRMLKSLAGNSEFSKVLENEMVVLLFSTFNDYNLSSVQKLKINLSDKLVEIFKSLRMIVYYCPISTLDINILLNWTIKDSLNMNDESLLEVIKLFVTVIQKDTNTCFKWCLQQDQSLFLNFSIRVSKINTELISSKDKYFPFMIDFILKFYDESQLLEKIMINLLKLLHTKSFNEKLPHKAHLYQKCHSKWLSNTQFIRNNLNGYSAVIIRDLILYPNLFLLVDSIIRHDIVSLAKCLKSFSVETVDVSTPLPTENRSFWNSLFDGRDPLPAQLVDSCVKSLSSASFFLQPIHSDHNSSSTWSLLLTWISTINKQVSIFMQKYYKLDELHDPRQMYPYLLFSIHTDRNVTLTLSQKCGDRMENYDLLFQYRPKSFIDYAKKCLNLFFSILQQSKVLLSFYESSIVLFEFFCRSLEHFDSSLEENSVNYNWDELFVTSWRFFDFLAGKCVLMADPHSSNFDTLEMLLSAFMYLQKFISAQECFWKNAAKRSGMFKQILFNYARVIPLLKKKDKNVILDLIASNLDFILNFNAKLSLEFGVPSGKNIQTIFFCQAFSALRTEQLAKSLAKYNHTTKDPINVPEKYLCKKSSTPPVKKIDVTELFIEEEIEPKKKKLEELRNESKRKFVDIESEDSDSMSGFQDDLMKESKRLNAQSGLKIFEKIERKPSRPIQIISMSNQIDTVTEVKRLRSIREKSKPDINRFHKEILKLDFNSAEAPKGTIKKVPVEFEDYDHYFSVFEPLLLLECQAQILRAQEEFVKSDNYHLEIYSVSIVNDFYDICLKAKQKESKFITDFDLLHLGFKGPSKNTKPHVMAMVTHTKHVRGQLEVYARARPADQMSRYIRTGNTCIGNRLCNLVTSNREYEALIALRNYAMLPFILKPRWQPVKGLENHQLTEKFQKVYNLNRSQAESITLSCINQNPFTFIQGPPGTGKTTTICSIIGAFLSNEVVSSTIKPAESRDFAHRQEHAAKILVCAPSNAAVDEIIRKLVSGLKDSSGKKISPNIVRIGFTEIVHDDVKPYCLDNLIAESSGMSDQKTQKKINEIKESLNMIERDTRLSSVDRSKKISVLKKELWEAQNEQKRLLKNIEDSRNSLRQRILNKSQIICSTLSGSGHESMLSLNHTFEYVIIDEACQAVELSCLIPLRYGCKKCILVGDPNQLPPTVLSMAAQDYSYEQSLFQRMQSSIPDSLHMLSMQYRMHPSICKFPSECFYENKLQSSSNLEKLRDAPWHKNKLTSSYLFFDIPGQEQTKRQSFRNNTEANCAVHLVQLMISENPDVDFSDRIGIITPYKEQLRELKSRFSQAFGVKALSQIEINTVDGFQGKEKDIIIISCVRANGKGLGFVTDVRRMNVALTRARCSLFVLGHDLSLSRNKVWEELLDDAHKRGCYVKYDPDFWRQKTKNRSFSKTFSK